MDTEAILRKIVDRKKVSVQLKQSTENLSSLNTQTVKGILKMTMQAPEISNNPISKQQSNRIATEPGYQSRTPTYRMEDSVPGSQNLRKNQSAYYNSVNSSVLGMDESAITQRQRQYEYLTPAQQISLIGNENADLQEEIRSLQEQLRRLDQIKRQEQQQKWKDGLPYFVLHVPKVKIFYTRLTILEKDYDKIDYSQYKADLNIERMVLSQNSLPGLTNRSPKTISLLLADLKQVSYHNSGSAGTPAPYPSRFKQPAEQQFLIIYYFKCHRNTNTKNKIRKNSKKLAFHHEPEDERAKDDESEIIEAIFMKFYNEAQFKEWDLGVYINYKINEDLNKPEVKLDLSSSAYASAKLNESESPKSNDARFKNLMHKYGFKNGNLPQEEQKQQYEENGNVKFTTNNIIEYLGFEESPTKVTPRSLGIKKLNSNIEQIEGGLQRIPVLRDRIESNIKIRDDLQSPQKQGLGVNRSSIDSVVNKQRSNTSHFGTLNAIGSEEKAAGNEDRGNSDETNKKQETKQMKRKEDERLEAMKKTELELSVKKARDSLRKGYMMTKYAKMAMSPYQKRVYLHEDGRRLCWQDQKNPGEPKWILITEIDSIKQGQIGRGIQSHIKLNKINKGCYVTLYLNSKDRKTLQLGSSDQLAVEQFCKDLQLYRKNGQ